MKTWKETRKRHASSIVFFIFRHKEKNLKDIVIVEEKMDLTWESQIKKLCLDPGETECAVKWFLLFLWQKEKYFQHAGNWNNYYCSICQVSNRLVGLAYWNKKKAKTNIRKQTFSSEIYRSICCKCDAVKRFYSWYWKFFYKWWNISRAITFILFYVSSNKQKTHSLVSDFRI